MLRIQVGLGELSVAKTPGEIILWPRPANYDAPSYMPPNTLTLALANAATMRHGQSAPISE